MNKEQTRVIKALFLDVDGTLLGPDAHISPKTKQSLLACKASGIKVFAATGRGPHLERALMFDAEEREILSDGGVFCNGGCLVIEGRTSWICLPEAVAQRCFDISESYDELQVIVQLDEDRISFRRTLSDDVLKEWGRVREELVPYEPSRLSGVIWISIDAPADLQADLTDRIRAAVGEHVNLLIHTWGSLEILDRRADKVHGIREVVRHFGWEDDEIAVFGDYLNDVGMLQGFPHSFAMGNASDEVKAQATYITRHHLDDGIHHALQDVLKLI